ncbi:MAG TPA: 4Fe-4S dicluster domain-containing protein [Polyangiaceae bacterium]|jgi:molybdopterin-containing oxidoreductase family iron-sulfur binding subunit|nr:4Fe-4S dicluster domain-containing protein [Polyangiaceae bacterium]
MTPTPPSQPNDDASGVTAGDGDLLPASLLTRRRFVEWLGVGMAALGANACSKPPREDIVPYVRRPPEVTPGVARYYATSTSRDGYGIGLLAKSQEGRPTKLEGHPEHPASLGGTGMREQAALFALYDPDRARTFLSRGKPTTWDAFTVAFGSGSRRPFVDRRGAGLALVLEPSASPLRASLLGRLRARYPELTVAYHATSGAPARWAAAKAALGEAADPQYRFGDADVVVSLDAELFGNHPMSLAWSRRFAERRKAARPGTGGNRLYAVESAMTLTGAAAEHRLATPASNIAAVAAALLGALATAAEHALPPDVAAGARRLLDASPHRVFVEAMARDLLRRRGRSAIVVGDRQPSHVHVLGYACNALVGNLGATLEFTAAPLPDAGEANAYALDGVLAGLDAGRIDTLFVLGPNPAYTLPAEMDWTRRASRAGERVHLSLYENETSEGATWFLPASHFLEHWGDARAYDGTASFVQPLIEPLYAGKSADEVLAALASDEVHDGRALLAREWASRLDGSNLDDALRRGVIPGSAANAHVPELDWRAVASALERVAPPASGLELELCHDARLGDGDAANNPWLQELAEPLTKLVWGNAALVGRETAARLAVDDGDVVVVEQGVRRMTLPVLIDPGHAEGAVTVWLGHGRRAGGRIAVGVGRDAAGLRSAASPWFVRGVTVRRTGAREALVRTQLESSQHDRAIVLRKSAADWARDPDFAREEDEDPPSILPERLAGDLQWGMAIDLSACLGCSACMVACAVENNVPVVGRENVALSREMYWLRIDRYYGGSARAPVVDFQPMLCQHCEKAPCEYVCPVNATVHSPDGLNEMVYNRCVGTRFCSNNCPYKVRRFNFFNYNQDLPETARMAKNPDVTVRARGVMEKCTYCVQRIRRAEIDARVAGRKLADGDVVTACEQACPTRAITFGNVADPRSRVAVLHADRRTYAVLAEVGTRPRTRYLARIDDPNPELAT